MEDLNGAPGAAGREADSPTAQFTRTKLTAGCILLTVNLLGTKTRCRSRRPVLIGVSPDVPRLELRSLPSIGGFYRENLPSSNKTILFESFKEESQEEKNFKVHDDYR